LAQCAITLLIEILTGAAFACGMLAILTFFNFTSN